MISRVVIVGLGRIGMGYDLEKRDGSVLTHARAFSEHQSFELVGAIETSTELCERFERLYGVRAFSSVEAGLQSCAPEVVVVATPTATRKEVIEQVLGCHSVHTILCEKPLALSLDEALAIKNMCETRGVKVYANYYRRALPGAKRAKEFIESGGLGDNVTAVSWYSGGLLHNGTHMIDLLQYWFGNLAMATLIGEQVDASHLGVRERRSPDAALEFAGGQVILVGRGASGFDLHEIEVVGDRGAIRFDGLTPDAVEIFRYPNCMSSPVAAGHQLNCKHELLGLQWYQLEVVGELASALNGDNCSLATIQEAVDNVRTIEAILDFKRPAGTRV
jgi:predicted dehydrogenase